MFPHSGIKMRIFSVRIWLLGLSLLGLVPGPVAAAVDPKALLQLADYVAVDYPEAVRDGAIVNAAEYAEMREFGARILGLSQELEPGGTLVEMARHLAALIESRATADEVAAASRAVREQVLAAHPVVVTPATEPDLERAETLYRQVCATCHGPDGRGDGPLGEGLDPAPTDFRDSARAAQRSLYGLYNTITLGVEGTEMASFAQFPDADRWALAFYVGSLAATREDLVRGAAQLAAGIPPPLDPRTAIASTPAEIARTAGEEAAAAALYLRSDPERLFAERASPLEVARQKIELAVTEFRAGDRAAASTAALSAYLDGFELAESSLSTVDRRLMRRAEADMFAIREVVDRADATIQDVERSAAAVLAVLAEAEASLEGSSFTPAVVFASSGVILLREGLEAILILAAIVAFLIKTGRRDALAYVHVGWMAALALGVATWAVSTWLLSIGGATRELTEGVTALFAAIMLFYVGFWMHSKLNARRWSAFLHQHVGQALEGGTLWAITLMSFVAVYREVFETVLFYQALWTQVGSAGRTFIFAGAGAAAMLLVASAWLFFKAGVRLPLKQFFGASAAVMVVLAVIFAGKGVAALQEAGRIPMDSIGFFPRIDLLGLYPSWQSLGAQALMIAAAAGLVLYSRRDEPANH